MAEYLIGSKVANSNEYMAEYMKSRRIRRRVLAIAYLGGKCNNCGEVTDDLEFDHIDRKTKLFTISSGLDKSWPVILRELDKCQLLCKPCHVVKSSNDFSHGEGLSGKRGCYCELCKPLKREYLKNFRRSHPRFD